MIKAESGIIIPEKMAAVSIRFDCPLYISCISLVYLSEPKAICFPEQEIWKRYRRTIPEIYKTYTNALDFWAL
jgi:hypothetical protein